MRKLAIDFGTTNSVIATWDEDAGRSTSLHLPGLSINEDKKQPLVPSLVYIHDGKNRTITAGRAVQEAQLDIRPDNRLFRNFKRGIVTTASTSTRIIDGQQWSDEDAGDVFIRAMLNGLPTPIEDVEQIVLTAPVASFQSYISWLHSAINDLKQIRIVDESTAAALGYTVTEPGALVLVFDFGGGTLDMSLVKLPESKASTGGVLGRLIGGKANQHRATVIAKAGRNLGGSDVDQWLLSSILSRLNVSIDELGADYSRLLTQCEQAKIDLSTQETAEVEFAGQTIPITRQELNAILRDNGFFTALRRVIDKVMITARQQGVFREDIHHVLMVGGTSLMPAVQNTLKDYFTDMAVRADKPFTAVAEGALQVACGFGVQDYLVHSYGIRHLDPTTNVQQYDEIIPMGTVYPMDKPIEVYLGAAHEQQSELEIVVGEIDTDAVSMIEVQYQDGQATFVAQANRNAADIIPLNLDMATVVPLDPPGMPGDDRIKAEFHVDEQRRLLVTITDLQAHRVLISDHVVASLR